METTLLYAAALYSLNLVLSEELVEVADAALDAGLYSDSLGELATERNPIMSECGPLFESALSELGLCVPSVDDSVWIVLGELLSRIAHGALEPREGMALVDEYLVLRDHVTAPPGGYLGGSHGIEELVGALLAIVDVAAGDYGPSRPGRNRSVAELEAEIVELATRWGDEHKSRVEASRPW